MRPRLYLMATAAVAAVPILLFAAVLVYNQAGEQRGKLEERVWRTASDAATALDKMLARHIAALEAITYFIEASPSDDGILAGDGVARLRNEHGWKRLRLIDAGSLEVVAGLGESGAAARPAVAAQIAQVIRSGRPLASVLPRELAGPAADVVVRVPVLHDGRIDMVLTADIRSRLLGDLLRQAAPGSQWTLAAIDPAFRIGGRNRAEERFVGTPITPSLRARIDLTARNFFFATNKEGERLYTLFSRSEHTGWTVAIGAPAETVETPLLWSNVTMAGAGAGAVAVAGLLAFFLVGNFERRRRAEDELRALAAEAATERRISEIARNFPGVIFRRVMHPDGRISHPFVSDGVEELLGVGKATLHAATPMAELSRRLHAGEETAWRGALEESARTMQPYKVEFSLPGPDGPRRLRSMGAPHREADGSVAWDGVLLDVSEEHRAEEQRRMLMSELDHRVRNILTVVTAIARLSLPRDASAEAFRGRIRALADAHAVLARTRWQGACLRTLVETELAPYRLGPGDSRVTIEGGPVSLRPAATQSLSLAIHELATNAAKHGALSEPDGEVRIGWTLARDPGADELRIVWQESRGPTVTPGERTGLGHRLIRESVRHDLGGTAELAFPPEGLRCTLRMPAGRVLAAFRDDVTPQGARAGGGGWTAMPQQD